MTDSIRLAKRLAELISCSRREAELYITGGWVSVDGQVEEKPQFMVSQQKVELHPEASLIQLEPTTIIFNLPSDQALNANSAQQLINADSQTTDDFSGIRMLQQHFARLTQSCPLEKNASGLMVFTQDYKVTRKLKEEAATIEQEYIVEVASELSAEGLKLLNHGLSFNGKPLLPIKVSWQNETRLRFALKGALPGQISHMCKSVDLKILTMKRIRIGRVSMAKLQPGLWRYLMPFERF